MKACTEIKRPRACLGVCVLLAFGQLLSTGPAAAQEPASKGRFIMGPLAWTPILAIRDAGFDSNVFNTPKDPREDITSSVAPSVDSLLTLGMMQLRTQGEANYLYFERYRNERALNGRVASKIQFPTARIQPIVSGSWARLRDRSGNELDARAPRTELAYAAGLATQLTPDSSLELTVGRNQVQYDAGVVFRDVDIATRLNRNSTMADVVFRSSLSPFTKVIVSVGAARDEFIEDPNRGSDNLRGMAGFEFASDAVIRGRATVGYHVMEPRGSDRTLGFDGWTTTVDLSYSLLGRTLFNGHLSRDSSYSVFDGRSFYVSTTGSLRVLHNLVGPVDLDLHGIREKLDYTETPAGLPARADYADIVGGGIAVRVSNESRIGIYYDDQLRRSSAGPDLGYRRQHLYTSVTYGF